MLHHLPALLATLASKPLAANDSDPLAIFDAGPTGIWMSDVCMDRSGRALACELDLMLLRDDSVRPMIKVDLAAGRVGWSIRRCLVAGMEAGADPEAVLAALSAVRHQIRAGLVPDVDGALYEFAGLQMTVPAPTPAGEVGRRSFTL